MIRTRIDLLELRNTKVEEVENIGTYEMRILQDLYDTMHSGPGYVGFAAPQIGHFKQIILVDDANGSIDLMINPKLLDVSGQQMHIEGCFSVPGIGGYAVSPYQIKLQYFDSNFCKRIVIKKGFAATIASHEYGHLIGELFLDRSKEIFAVGMNIDEEERRLLFEKYPSRVIRRR